MKKKEIRNLKFRYLLWLYKNTKEQLDRIERKFTQLDIDYQILKYLSRNIDFAQVKNKQELDKHLAEFSAYVARKEKDARAAKFSAQRLKPDYYFISLKLEAIERVVIKEFGKKSLTRIKALYEEEMRKRILESKEH